MNKNKLLVIICIGLLISNLILIGFILMKKAHHKEANGPKNLIIKKLDLDETQVKSFELLIANHRPKIKGIAKKIGNTKQALYQTLNKSDSLASDSLIAKLSELNTEIDQLFLSHFRDISNLCRPDQKKRFEALTNELANLFSPRGKRPPKR